MYADDITGQRLASVTERLFVLPPFGGNRTLSGSDIGQYVAKIEARGPLPADARAALLGLKTIRRTIGAHEDMVRKGDRPDRSCLVVSGIVSRYKTLRDGARQIVSFHIAGDMVDLQSALVMVADHSIHAHTPTEILTIAHADLLDLAARYPTIGRALWFDTLVDAAIFREWTVNVGRRNSYARTAHLLLEFEARLDAIGMVTDHTFKLPITQNDLADALSMTPVHLNRLMQRLRGERLIRTHMRSVTIENPEEMRMLAGFDPTYLHAEGQRQPPG